jgi:Domain of unknown function (DUF1963)
MLHSLKNRPTLGFERYRDCQLVPTPSVHEQTPPAHERHRQQDARHDDANPPQHGCLLIGAAKLVQDLHYGERANLMIHQMLGHYDNMQPYPAGTDIDARLLLQVDPQDNNGMSWGRDGKLYFFIHDRDLAARRWDTVWTREQ